jgi:hypothetical protein
MLSIHWAKFYILTNNDEIISLLGQIFIAAPINLKDKAAGMDDFKSV